MYKDLEDTGSGMVVVGGDIKLGGVQFIDMGALLHDLDSGKDTRSPFHMVLLR